MLRKGISLLVGDESRWLRQRKEETGRVRGSELLCYLCGCERGGEEDKREQGLSEDHFEKCKVDKVQMIE